AKRTVHAPDGSKLSVNAPDDASDDEVLEFVQNKLQEQERAKERKSLVTMIEAQKSGVELLRKDVMNMAKLVVKLTERINHIDQRKMPEPVVNVAAPSVKINPEVRVIADPGMAAAMMDMHKAHDETMKAVTAALDKLSAMPAPEQHHEVESKIVAYDIEHETDRHSPRFGRIKRVVPQVETQ
ncbi:MAG: hypothetical protein WAW75_00115, partial [Gallionella sp.]